MAHPLEGAFAKFDAALEHFETLTDEADAFLHREDKPYDLTMEFDERESCFTLIGHVFELPPLRLSTRIGDVVHNLACALDHAMFELGRFRAGREIDRTFFPIFGDVRGYRKFRRRRNSFMRHLTVRERTLVNRVQPYRGGDFAFNHPLAQLYRLWNQDKHRTPHLTLAMIAEYGFELVLVQDVAAIEKMEVRLGAVVDGAPVLWIYVVPDGPSPQVKLKSEVTMDIAIDEGIRIRSLLAAIGDWVETILNVIVKEAFPESPSWDVWKATQSEPPSQTA
jgi:hypothetical protein